MRLNDKVAIITGASSGIGRASGVLFAKEGAKVIIVDIAQKGGLETVKMIRKNGGEATFVKTDVSRASDVKRMVKATMEKYGKIDVLFNNAGINLEKTVTDTSEEEWDRVIDVNLKGAFLCSKNVIPEMMQKDGGVIINTASMFGLVGQVHESAYCASKGGMVLLTKAMALDYGPYNIRVNCICPDMIQTPIHEAFIATLAEPEREVPEMLKTIPLSRFGQPEEIARAALFLASDESSYITGVALPVNGGRMQHC